MSAKRRSIRLIDGIIKFFKHHIYSPLLTVLLLKLIIFMSLYAVRIVNKTYRSIKRCESIAKVHSI